MKKHFFLFLFLVNNLLYSQDSIPTVKYNLLNTNYKDFIVVNNEVYSITKGDSLVILNILNNSISLIKPNVNAIAKNSINELYITTPNSQIIHFKNNNWIVTDSLQGKNQKILIDKKDNPIFITDKGIYYKGKSFNPNKRSKIYNRKWKSNDTLTNYLRTPDLAYLDTKSRVWLTYDFGEWGTKTWFFELNTCSFFEEDFLTIDVNYNEFKNDNKYLIDLIKAFPNKIKKTNKNILYKFPAQLPIYDGVKGMAEDNNGNIYISQSLYHFSLSGGIEVYSETVFDDFYHSKDLNDILEYHKRIIKRGNKKDYESKTLLEYLGPITFNKFNNSMYYYSNLGFFKIINKKEVFSKELILKPELIWKSGLAHSVGSQMAIKKFVFLDQTRFVFLTNSNGIGYFDNTKITYFH